MTKYLIQQNALEYSKKFYLLTLEWATGTGKTLAAIKIMHNYKDICPKFNIVVAETAHIKNWEDEFKKHGYESLLKQVNIFCYQSLHKNVEKDNVMWIFDEAHRITRKRLDNFRKSAKPFKMILLSATFEQDKKLFFKEYLNRVKESRMGLYKIGLSKAIREGLVPPPKITIIQTNLTDEQRKEYDHITRRCEKLKSKVAGEPLLLTSLKRLFIKRKQMLGMYKTELAKKIIKEKLNEKRYIVFNTTTEQSRMLSECNIVDSKNPNATDVINAFNKKHINYMHCVEMLKEGMNLTDIEAVLVIQLFSKKLNIIQQIGRALRSALPEVYIIVAKGTIDEKYIENLKSLERYIKYENY